MDVGRALVVGVTALLLASCDSPAQEAPQDNAAAYNPFASSWPETDFSRASIEWDEVLSGGPPRDGIPPIDDPQFVNVDDVDHADTVPVMSIEINGDARTYPLSILMWHEVVNDIVGGEPVVIAYCPLCNSGAAFERTINGRVHDFGTSGLLRNSDLIMYDRQTFSWWQQFTGDAIVGELMGTDLEWVPVRMESFAAFKAREPDGQVLVPNNPRDRDYGANPYEGYDSTNWPFLYRGEFEDPVAPLSRVVVVGTEAWPLDLVRDSGPIDTGELLITWEAGQNSALDTRAIERGADVGTVSVQRRTDEGMEDAVYMVPFAFAFRAFHPDGVLHTEID